MHFKKINANLRYLCQIQYVNTVSYIHLINIYIYNIYI